MSTEINFDGLVGPTHNYSGLSLGNVASTKNAFIIAHPRMAAIQGLTKMKLLLDLGIPQAVLPPHERPYLPFLRQIGYEGSDIKILKEVNKHNPNLFRSIYSASSMWAANAATVATSSDTRDHKVHITPANLISNVHRFLEADMNYTMFKKIFHDEAFFTVHRPLANQIVFSDEGAANYNRLCEHYGDEGLSIFVYGKNGFNQMQPSKDNTEVEIKIRKEKLPRQYPARQTLEASQAIARLHQLKANTLFLRQNPDAIDAGVFHNDVISVANQNVFLFHELAFAERDGFPLDTKVTEEIMEHFKQKMHFIKINNSELDLETAVNTFLFNSQLVTLKNKQMVLIAPIECETNLHAQNVIHRIIAEDNPITNVHYVDCRQSMQNGGGPACLRLRVVLTDAEKKACHQSVFLNDALYDKLLIWINKHYRESIQHEDLLDPELLKETYSALDELTQILQLGSIYSFQK